MSSNVSTADSEKFGPLVSNAQSCNAANILAVQALDRRSSPVNGLGNILQL